ncbi:MAG: 1-deoxy-D-xylulose-5-phosphate synthase [Patescibacteria group bacterium]|nr:1-deoxy-D-xylulose-5-phosphate synthase [Patescibacteria group bacterium]
MSLLKKIKRPKDLKSLKIEELSKLAEEIREEILTTVSKRGGHLASNLGAVELTLGLHLALDLPKDKIVWDVGHQCYTHKLLTGRQEEFSTLRSYKGLCGFPRREESKYDTANTGHASTSVSTALGLARARDLKGEDFTIVAVIGDGSLTGGLAYEGLNQAGQSNTNIIIVLKTLFMSIGKNVGALADYLNRLRSHSKVKKVRKEAEERLSKIPTLGDFLVNLGKSVNKSIRKIVLPGRLFEELGFRYYGPIDGHDPLRIVEAISFAQDMGGPVLIHAFTVKGKGYKPAEDDPTYFHGISPFNLTPEKVETVEKNGKKRPSYTEVFSDMMLELSEKNKDIVAITAAMADGTGLSDFAKKYPNRFFDVGIAEEHAVTFAAGLALNGLKPVVAIYSTFLQRAYDQIIHDVALTGLPVIFVLDRAGLVGEDGPTHHGLFDLTYLKSIPGMTVMAPSNEQELRDMLETAITINGPVAIRFPRGKAPGVPIKKASKLKVPEAKMLKKGNDVLVLAVGRMVENALEIESLLKAKNISTTVVDVRFTKPFDEELFLKLIPKHKLVVTLEENGIGGFADSISKFMLENKLVTPTIFCHIPDRFITHGAVKDLMKDAGIDPESVADKVIKKLKENLVAIK